MSLKVLLTPLIIFFFKPTFDSLIFIILELHFQSFEATLTTSL